MSDFLLLVVWFVAVVNPAGIAVSAGGVEAGWRKRGLLAVAAGVLAAVVLLLLAVMADDILEGLEVERETFRIAAGIVFLVAAARMVILGPWRYDRGLVGWWAALIPLAFPVMFTPELAAAAVAYGADEGTRDTFWAGAVALAIAVGLVALPGMGRDGAWRTGMTAAARILGGLLIVVASGLVVDGVRAI